MFVAIIQARMGSTRLPGKVMKKVLDKPLIEYLLERVSKSKYIDKIILATTTNSEDDTLANYVSSLGYDVFRGSEDDVLGRYYNAYLTLGDMKDNVNGIIRITGDCPLFESDICDELISSFIDKGLDYSFLSPNFAEGLDCEVFLPDLLKEAYFNSELNSEREHITQYFHNNKKKFKINFLENTNNDSKYRITVDEPEDYLVVKNILEHFILEKELSFSNIKKYLDSQPELFKLNSNIIRNEGLLKSLKDEKD